jgi:hypothetical protein
MEMLPATDFSDHAYTQMEDGADAFSTAGMLRYQQLTTNKTKQKQLPRALSQSSNHPSFQSVGNQFYFRLLLQRFVAHQQTVPGHTHKPRP